MSPSKCRSTIINVHLPRSAKRLVLHKSRESRVTQPRESLLHFTLQVCLAHVLRVVQSETIVGVGAIVGLPGVRDELEDEGSDGGGGKGGREGAAAKAPKVCVVHPVSRTIGIVCKKKGDTLMAT